MSAVDDPWVLAIELFSPAYIGGWTAAQHWGLTEQLFRETFVVSSAHIRERNPVMFGSHFQLARVARARVESVAPVWRGTERIRVSSAERTLVDGCANPWWVGGTRHLVEMVNAYRDSRIAAPERLAADLAAFGNGAAHKRLGYIVEQVWPESRCITEAAERGRSTGVIRLDPAVASRGRMNKRWGLWLNTTLAEIDR